MPNHVHLLIRTLDVPISRLVQSLLVSHTQRHHRCHRSSGHVWQGRFKSPVIQDDDHLLTVLRYIEANPLRARLVPRAGDYPWSSFAEHGKAQSTGLLDPVVAYDELAGDAAERRRLWSDFVHQEPPESERSALRRSVVTGLPYGSPTWVEQLGRDLGLDLEIRPRGRPAGSRPRHWPVRGRWMQAGWHPRTRPIDRHSSDRNDLRRGPLRKSPPARHHSPGAGLRPAADRVDITALGPSADAQCGSVGRVVGNPPILANSTRPTDPGGLESGPPFPIRARLIRP